MRLSFVYRDISYVVGGVEMDKKEGIGRIIYVGDKEIELVCPICGGKTEVYSRITGYYRPIQNWNDGKLAEYQKVISKAFCRKSQGETL